MSVEMPKGSNSTSNHTFIDLFAGCGGLSLGLMQAGWKGLFAVERDRYAYETLKANLVVGHALSPYRYDWPDWLPASEHEIGAFIKTYKPFLRQLRYNVDLIAGGPPCQGFSMAGRRDETDPRNQLFQHYLDVVRLIRPKFLIIENVQGISVGFTRLKGEVCGDSCPEGPGDPANSDQGKSKPFSEIIRDHLTRMRPGYRVFGDVVRASEYGVPQWRPRFIMIGIRKDVWSSLTESLSNEECDPHLMLQVLRHDFARMKGLEMPVTCSQAIGDFVGLETQDSQESKGFRELVYKLPEHPNSYVRMLRANMGSSPPNSLRIANHRDQTVRRWKEIQGDSTIRKGVKLTSKERERFGILGKHSFAVLDPHRPSHTLTTLPDDLLHYCEPRILTVRECARLQSFPDWFEFRGKYTTGGDRRTKEAPRYTQVGNAVPPLLGEALGRVLMRLDRIDNGLEP